MSFEQSKGIIRRIYEEVLNAGNLDLAREVIAAEAVDHAPHSRSSLPIGGNDSIEDFLVEFCTAFPDVYWMVEQMQPDGDTVVVRTTVSGNHHAEFRGLRPTGRQFTLAAVDTVRLSEGKIVEHWGELDMASLQQQLAIPFLATDRQDVPERETVSP
jgi:predicted ester cyclase